MKSGVSVKIVNIRGENMMAAADLDIIGVNLKSGKLHLYVDPKYYGDTEVTWEFFDESLALCSIGNFVGKKVVERCIKLGFVDRDNILYIQDVPHAQYARMLR